MFGRQDVTSLQLRKKALVLESSLNRIALRAECERLREAADGVSRIMDTGRHIAPWALVLAPLAGVALALRLRRSAPGEGLLSRALGLAPSLIQLWRTWFGASSQSK
jgi:hypothetical protein